MRLAWFLTATVCAAACGDDELTFSVDAGPDAAPIDAELPGPVTVTVTGAGGPIADVDVVFNDASGAVLGATTTDPSGEATAMVPSGGAVTVAVVSGGAHASISWLGVEPGDELTWAVEPPTPTSVGPVRVTLPGAFAGATHYTTQLGCADLAETTDGAADVTGAIPAPCLGSDGMFDVVASALDAGNNVVAYAFDTDVVPTAAGTTAVVLPAWQTARDPLQVDLSGAPGASPFVGFEQHFRLDGLEFVGPGAGAALTSGAASLDVGYLQLDPDQLQFAMFLPLGQQPGDGFGALIGGVPNTPATLSYDLSMLLPPVGGVTAVNAGGRVELTYLSTGSFASIADGALVLSSWQEGAANHIWYAIAPPGLPNTFQLPAMPDELADFRPTATSTFPTPSVIFVEADYVDDYADLRTGLGFAILGDSAVDTVPLTGGLLRASIGGQLPD